MNSRSWIEINKNSLLHNIQIIRAELSPHTKLMAVLKANAYGHGLKEISQLVSSKVDWIGVDNNFEALALKKSGITNPILILGYTRDNDLREVIENDISFVCYSIDQLKYINTLELYKKAKVHLKVETGLNRQGIQQLELKKAVEIIKRSETIFLEGLSSHYANIEDTLDSTYAMYQLENFQKETKILKKRFPNILLNTAASAGVLLYPQTHLDMVRVGISLYGIWPSRETMIAMNMKRKKTFKLRPVLSWKSVVAQVKEIQVGDSVGYGRSWYAARKSTIAIIPVGYSDGYDRQLSNSGRVIIHDTYAPVIGRVAMNMIIVDVTDIANVKRDDEVVLLGKGIQNEINVEELSVKVDTIPYEILARINPELRRLIV